MQRSSPKVANIADIENQIRALWQEVGEQAHGENAVTRVCTLTLIAYGADATLARRVRAAVPKVFGDHPCRALLIEADGAPDELSAWVTTVCQRQADEGEQVCCEQITLTVGETMRRRLPGTVLPLVVSDLPVFVWWPGPFHPASNVRTQLFAHADRWIADSRDFASPLRDLVQLHTLLKDDQTIAVSDLEWARLTPWRTMLANAFDLAVARPALDRLSELTLRTNGALSATLLAAGWLASALRWQASGFRSEGQSDIYSFDGPAGPVALTIVHDDSEPGRLPLLTTGCASMPSLTVGLECHANGQSLVSTVHHDGETITQVGALPADDDGLTLAQELNVYSHDRIYEATLATLAAMAAIRGQA
ncbi:MAG TPA: glucose-6-phosphate dehydrogenase assembly protein OpcA [Herpetosiphonaceae bacterium]|nr:glucose-6-phosphate dehydrogenase assembly protein OpcA [Herpetosiphonaceae bacterium]